MKLFAVAGNPILHSRSPDLHRPLFSLHGYEAAYTRVHTESAADIRLLFKEVGFSGMNITAPFKESLLPVLDRLDDSALTTGAVNTVLTDAEGLKGYNTDPDGVAAAFAEAGVTLRGQRVLVLGAGGAARAAAYALKREGADVSVVNRTREKALRLTRELNCRSIPWTQLRESLGGSRIIVNAIAAAEPPFPPEWLPKRALILDADYRSRPLETAAQSRECRYLAGTEWLLGQGLAAFSLFTGITPAESRLDLIRSHITGGHTRKTGLALIGFMAAGKSTVGPMLAQRLGYQFLDLDDWIEEHEGMKISEIFSRRGETRFRQLECKAVREHAGQPSLVLSCGGGAVLNADSRDRLQRHGWVVWLYSPWTLTRERMREGNRPLLRNPDPDATAMKLFAERKTLYARTADLLIINRTKPEEVADAIYHEIDPYITH